MSSHRRKYTDLRCGVCMKWNEEWSTAAKFHSSEIYRHFFCMPAMEARGIHTSAWLHMWSLHSAHATIINSSIHILIFISFLTRFHCGRGMRTADGFFPSSFRNSHALWILSTHRVLAKNKGTSETYWRIAEQLKSTHENHAEFCISKDCVRVFHFFFVFVLRFSLHRFHSFSKYIDSALSVRGIGDAEQQQRKRMP